MLDLNKIEPDFFKEFKRKNHPHSYKDDCDNYELRKDLRENIFLEQNGQCFYCEKEIKDEHNIDKVHLDHIKQRNYYHLLKCNYDNIVLSCNGDGEKYCAKFKDKNGLWDDTKYLKLEIEKPSDFFRYISNGKIKAKKSLSEEDKERVENTINYLNLNHSDLIGARKTIFSALQSYEQQGLNKQNLFSYFNEFESIFIYT